MADPGATGRRASVAALVAELGRLVHRFSPAARAAKRRLLVALGDRPLARGALLLQFHEALGFMRAYPDDPAILAAVEAALAGFAKRVAALSARQARVLEETGVAGTTVYCRLSRPAASWLARSAPAAVELDWSDPQIEEALGAILPLVVDPAREEALVEVGVSYRAWLGAAKGDDRRTDLAWLLDRLARRGPGVAAARAVYDQVQPRLAWRLGDGSGSRTRAAATVRRPFFQRGPLLRRGGSVSRRRGAAVPVRAVSPGEGSALLDTARAAVTVRYREVHGFNFADPRDVVVAAAGRGVRIAWFGVLPAHRLPLRAHYGYVLLKNGVPVGYGDASLLFDWCEIAYNVFETFRGGEAAWMFVRLLDFLRGWLGTRTFLLSPYQLGHGNEEAVLSGAFWFYAKLGFRPIRSDLARLAADERSRIAADPSHRSSPETLARLSEGRMWLAVGSESPPEPAVRDFDVGRLARRAAAPPVATEALARRRRTSGWRRWPAAEREALRYLGPILARIADLPRWAARDRRALVAIVRAKGGPHEAVYLRRMQRHRRLRRGILALGSPEAGAS